MLRFDETTGQTGVFRQPAGLHQRQHRRPRGTARHLRARQPARHPHRARRAHHRRRRPLRGQALQQPERRGGEIGRLDLVHRPGLRHRFGLRGPQGRERDRRLPRLPRRPGLGRGRASSPTTSCARTASPSRPTRSASTSPTPASATSRTGRSTSASSRSPRTAGSRAATSSRPAPAASSTASASTTTAGSGRAPATACIATTRTGTLLGKVLVPERVANVVFGGPKRNRLFICATTSLYSVLLAGQRGEDVLKSLAHAKSPGSSRAKALRCQRAKRGSRTPGPAHNLSNARHPASRTAISVPRPFRISRGSQVPSSALASEEAAPP